MATRLSKNVYLIGFMGAGKSTVARKVARKNGVTSLDLDKYIERFDGREIKQIFADEGEDGFRKIETMALSAVSESDEPMLISCGGGIIERSENVEIMADSGFVIHLEFTAEEAAKRISDASTRPLFQDIEQARALCERRAPLYEQAAHVTVPTHGNTLFNMSRQVTRLLRSEGIMVEE